MHFDLLIGGRKCHVILVPFVTIHFLTRFLAGWNICNLQVLDELKVCVRVSRS